MQTHKAMATKLPLDEYVLIQDYCKRVNKTPSQLIRELLLSEANPFSAPSNAAGRNIIEYDRKRDSFIWKVELDNGEKAVVLEDLPLEYLTDLSRSVASALTLRDELQGKKRKDSAIVPRKLLRGKK